MKENQNSKWFEIVVTALGVLVTGVLGWGQYQLGERQNQILENQRLFEKKRAIDSIEVQVMTFVSSHLGNLGSSGTQAQQSQKIVMAAAEYLTDSYGRTSLANMAAKISEGNQAVSNDVRSRLVEATVPPTVDAPWYAVLASIPGDEIDKAQSIADMMLEKAKNLGFTQGVQLFKTKISNHYAVVIGGSLKEADAKALAAQARQKSLASDSFAQKDRRKWSFIGIAPFN